MSGRHRSRTFAGGSNNMQIVQAVFGVFHHFELPHQLHARKHLRRIYSTWPWARLKRQGLPRELVRTFPLVHTADYLLRRTPIYSPALDERFTEWNSISFDAWTRRMMRSEERRVGKECR